MPRRMLPSVPFRPPLGAFLSGGLRVLVIVAGTILVATMGAWHEATAQALVTKTTNLESPHTTPVGELHFPFTHRFSLISTKVVNSPTFSLSTGITSATGVSLRWASNSRLASEDSQNPLHKVIGTVNEFEVLVKHGFWRELGGMPLDLTGAVAYNTAANSGDVGLIIGRSVGPVSVLTNLKGFSSGFGLGGYTAVASGGLRWQLTKFLNLNSDVGGVIWAQNDPAIFGSSNVPAISLGLGFEIPYSPHTVLLYVTNADTHTLQGTSRGAPSLKTDRTSQILDQLRFGFELNIPFTSGLRWIHIVSPPPEPTSSESQAPQTGAISVQPEPQSVPAPQRDPLADMPATSAREVAIDRVSAASGSEAPKPLKLPEQVVAIKGFAFTPATLTVAAGTPIRWVNKHNVFHTSTSDKTAWDSGMINPGASWVRTFEQPGTYAYHCTPHPFMVGTVVVK